MSGKRKGGVYLEPREASSTDKKTRTSDEHIHEEDKQHLHARRGKLAIPTRGENPALQARKRSAPGGRDN